MKNPRPHSYEQSGQVFRQSDGPAIWGGCVTRREHRPRPVFFSQKIVRVQGGYGTCFCRHGTRFDRSWACRGTSLIGAGKLSRYIGFILRVMARIRVHILVGLVLGAGFCKNRDKQLTHIVRVSCSCFVKLLGSHFIPFWVMSQISKS